MEGTGTESTHESVVRSCLGVGGQRRGESLLLVPSMKGVGQNWGVM